MLAPLQKVISRNQSVGHEMPSLSWWKTAPRFHFWRAFP